MKKIVLLLAVLSSALLGASNERWYREFDQTIHQIKVMSSLDDWEKSKEKISEFEASIHASDLTDKEKLYAVLDFNEAVFDFWSKMGFAVKAKELREGCLTKVERAQLNFAEEVGFGMDSSGLTLDRVSAEYEAIAMKIEDAEDEYGESEFKKKDLLCLI